MQDLATLIVRDYRELISLPEVVMQVNAMVEDPDCSIEALGELLSHDPGLTLRLLGIANSPFYGFASEISDVRRAVALLGMKQVRDLVVSTAAAKTFANVSVDIIAVEDFWMHSLYCGLVAQSLADSLPGHFGSLFTVGLLHDVGQLLLFHRYPQQMSDAILATVEGEHPLEMVEAENEFIGTDHTRVGAELARNWNLPAQIVEVIAFHHTPGKAREFARVVGIVHIANAIAEGMHLSDAEVIENLRLDPVCWEQTGLGMDDLPAAIEFARQQLGASRQAFFNHD